MKFPVLSFITVCLSNAVVGKTDWHTVADEEDAETYLKALENSTYNSKLAPLGINGSGTPIQVVVSMYFLSINRPDAYGMDFNAHFYFRQAWYDARLGWTPSRNPPITQNRNPVITIKDTDMIWTPDLFFVDEKEGSRHEVTVPNTFCKIKSDGEILYSSKYGVVFSCPMNLRWFPHDVQKCTINIESYGFQRKQMELKWLEGSHDAVSANPNITLLDFDIIDISNSAKYAKVQSGEYSSLQVHLTFKRKCGYFASRLYVPFIILVIISWLSLWITSENKWLRLALLLVIMYLMVTISLEVNLSVTPTSYLKASDVWIGFCESMVVAIFLEYIIVQLIYKKESDNKISEEDSELQALKDFGKEAKLDSPKSPLSKLISMLDTKHPNRGQGNVLSDRIDRICRVMFPVIFAVFNVLYWSICCTL